MKRGKFKVCSGDIPYPLGAQEFEGSSPRAFPLGVSSALSLKGWCVCPLLDTLPCLFACHPREGRRRGAGGSGSRRLAASAFAGRDEEAAGLRAAGGEGSAAAGPRGGGGAPSAGPRTHPMGPRGLGASAHWGHGVAQPSAAPAASLGREARQAGYSLSPLLSPSYKYLHGPHPPPPTLGALRTVRRPRAGQWERKGNRAAQVTDVAPAVRQPPQLEAWPPAAPALSLPPLPPAPRADSNPPAARATAEPVRTRPASAELADAGGGRPRNQAGPGAAGFSLACPQPFPLLLGGSRQTSKTHHPAGNQ